MNIIINDKNQIIVQYFDYYAAKQRKNALKRKRDTHKHNKSWLNSQF